MKWKALPSDSLHSKWADIDAKQMHIQVKQLYVSALEKKIGEGGSGTLL